MSAPEKTLIGQFHILPIIEENQNGYWLEIEEGEKVLMPASQVTKPVRQGDTIRVFLYKDSKNRLIATCKEPYAELGDFVALKVTDTNDFGAFLEWGIDKDLFVPKKEQRAPMAKGKTYVVKVLYDKRSDRMIGSSHIKLLLEREAPFWEENQPVELIPYEKTDIGWQCIIDKQGIGLLYDTEIHEPVALGQKLNGFIKKVREDDKVDVSLQPTGFRRDFISEEAQRIYEMLEETPKGFLPFHDKSEPEDIKNTFQMSKKTFKKAIGGLFRDKLILLDDKGIKLVSDKK